MESPKMEELYEEIHDIITKWALCHEISFAALDKDDYKTAALNMGEIKDMLQKALHMYVNINRTLGVK